MSDVPSKGETTLSERDCRNGHVPTFRYLATGKCVQCSKERFAKWYAANKDADVAKTNEWRAANPEKARAISIAWNHANREALSIRQREARRANPERDKAVQANRRARKKQAGGTHTGAEVMALLRFQKGKCAYCKIDFGRKYHKDHILPLKLGGDNSIRNIQILCQPCNQRKSALHPIDFARRIGRLV